MLNNTTAYKVAVALHASKILKTIPHKDTGQSRLSLRIGDILSLRSYIGRDTRLRALDMVLKSNPSYTGRSLEKYRYDVLLKLCQGMSYPKIVTWLKENKGFTVSSGTVKNFTISMVELGFLPKGMDYKLHNRAHRPWDINEASAIVLAGWEKGKRTHEIRKEISALGVANPRNLYNHVRLKLKTEKGLTARSLRKGHTLDPYRQEIIEAAMRGDYYHVIGDRYGADEKTVWRYVTSLVKEGRLPLYYKPKRKLCMHRPFIKRCVELNVSEADILWYLRKFYGVTVSQKCLRTTIRNLPKIPGL